MNSNTYISTEKLKVYAAGKLYGQEKLAVEAYLQENPEEQETVEAFRNYLNQGGNLYRWNWKMYIQKKKLFFYITHQNIQKSIKDIWEAQEAWVGGLFASFTPKWIIYAFGIVAIVVFIGINFPNPEPKPGIVDEIKLDTDSISPKEQYPTAINDSVMQNNQQAQQQEANKGNVMANVNNTKQDSTGKIVSTTNGKIVSTTNTNPPSANDAAPKQVASVIPTRIEPTVTDTFRYKPIADIPQNPDTPPSSEPDKKNDTKLSGPTPKK